jgi:hypothetical protein
MPRRLFLLRSIAVGTMLLGADVHAQSTGKPRLSTLVTGSMGSVEAVSDCSVCTDVGRSVALGVSLGSVTLGGRIIRWGSEANSMSVDLVTLDGYPFARKRANVFATFGIGRGKGAIAYSGGHWTDSVRVSNAMAYSYGAGIDLRLYQRLALTPFFLVTRTRGGTSRSSYCTQFNYPASFQFTCSTSTDRQLHLVEVGVGLGIR